ncbi:hypothetical protein [Sunxiuqinia dokdonensis]|uniref:Uncharacterized protein n=1 Tax=Sunxiuqinia dokdonensis TaxID=1409788 RepID=A0A0L8VAL2_9BACT|nr:hypothetical protein [Sunxiuqinia dokdonensis]KOH45212.1 hypothetical protein NC99_20740 [Sunxiuqinia dokdonensis]
MTKNKNLIYNHLKKITSSRHFVKSKISCDLLNYLTEASLEGKNPKELTIGVELFGKKYEDADKQDSNIRVYIHNVRKKLKDYYAAEGKKDPVIFVLEKGKYRVRFDSPKDHRKPVRYVFLIPFIVSFAALLVLGFLYFKLSSKDKTPWKELPVWQDFAESDKPTLLVLGDYFVFSGQLPTGSVGIYRDFNINSEVEYEHLLDKNPELIHSLSKSNLTYLSKMAAFCQSHIYKVFAQTGAPIHVKLSSDLQPDDLKNNNIIFVGNYKNMGLFENVVQDLEFSFGISSSSRQFIFADDPDAAIYRPANDNNKQTDYALVINTEGYTDNRFLLFLSTQDIGNISVVDQLTNPNYLTTLLNEKLTQLDPDNFKALYKVQGINKTDLAFELIRIE